MLHYMVSLVMDMLNFSATEPLLMILRKIKGKHTV